jgi:hypothetical protein
MVSLLKEFFYARLNNVIEKISLDISHTQTVSRLYEFFYEILNDETVQTSLDISHNDRA